MRYQTLRVGEWEFRLAADPTPEDPEDPHAGYPNTLEIRWTNPQAPRRRNPGILDERRDEALQEKLSDIFLAAMRTNDIEATPTMTAGREIFLSATSLYAQSEEDLGSLMFERALAVLQTIRQRVQDGETFNAVVNDLAEIASVSGRLEIGNPQIEEAAPEEEQPRVPHASRAPGRGESRTPSLRSVLENAIAREAGTALSPDQVGVISETLATRFPQRPPIDGDEINDRRTDKDPLLVTARQLCDETLNLPTPLKSHVISAIFEGAEQAYETRRTQLEM